MKKWPRSSSATIAVLGICITAMFLTGCSTRPASIDVPDVSVEEISFAGSSYCEYQLQDLKILWDLSATCPDSSIFNLGSCHTEQLQKAKRAYRDCLKQEKADRLFINPFNPVR